MYKKVWNEYELTSNYKLGSATLMNDLVGSIS